MPEQAGGDVAGETNLTLQQNILLIQEGVVAAEGLMTTFVSEV